MDGLSYTTSNRVRPKSSISPNNPQAGVACNSVPDQDVAQLVPKNRRGWKTLVVNVQDGGNFLESYKILASSKGMTWSRFVENALCASAHNLRETGNIFRSPPEPKPARRVPEQSTDNPRNIKLTVTEALSKETVQEITLPLAAIEQIALLRWSSRCPTKPDIAVFARFFMWFALLHPEHFHAFISKLVDYEKAEGLSVVDLCMSRLAARYRTAKSSFKP
jgi:hypothetical protein